MSSRLTFAILVILALLLAVPLTLNGTDPESHVGIEVNQERQPKSDELGTTDTGLASAVTFEHVVDRAGKLPRMHAMIVAQKGIPLVEKVFRGPNLDVPVNVKSVSKSVLSAMVGIAIDRGILEDVDVPLVSLLRDRVPEDADPGTSNITIAHLLAMQSGLERTSGRNYGEWISSHDWVAYALSRPFVDEPGGRMLYSTGNSHLLSAALSAAAGKSTLALAREWLAEPLAANIPPWPKDPQGVYLGGNDMALSPRALLRFGEVYRQAGVIDGKRILPEEWVQSSWTPRTRSVHSGHGYGYGWFITTMAGHPVYYGWGYGGQMLYVVPSLELTVVMTSDSTASSTGDGYIRALHELLATGIIPAAKGREAKEPVG